MPRNWHLLGQLAQVPQEKVQEKPYNKKQKYELEYSAANTKIGPHHIHWVFLLEGKKKYQALMLDVRNSS